MLRLTTATIAFSLPALTAFADVPRVVADIAPVHSLVAQVMGDLGTPELLTRPGDDPHHMQLRPSQARLLSNADLLVWMSPSLTPWLETASEGLAGDAVSLSLMATGPLPLELEGGHHDHDHGGHEEEDDHADEHGHDDHDDHADHEDDHAHDDHADEHAHDDHGDEHADEHGEDHAHDDHADEHAQDDHEDDHAHDEHAEDLDPHAWLDPVNAAHFLHEIAEHLGELDPENAATYEANATRAATALETLATEIQDIAEPARGIPLVAGHDAYGYLVARLGLNQAGAVTDAEDTPASAARIAEILAAVKDAPVVCFLAEPGIRPPQALADGRELKTATLDPLGKDFALGPDHYAATLTALANALASCAE